MKALKALLLIPLAPVLFMLFIMDTVTDPCGNKANRLLDTILS